MKYSKKVIKEGVTLHLLKNRLKTDFSVVFLSIPLCKETITKNALLPAILKSGSKKYPTFQILTEKLEMLYGASFDCGLDKTGDNIVLKFYVEGINDNYLPKPNDNLIKSINILFDIIFNPLIEKDKFKDEYVEREKRNLEMIIKEIKDDKDSYSYQRCIELMYNENGYGLSKYGKIEDLKNINSNNLYEYYKKTIETSKIDIIISGDFNNKHIEKFLNENNYIKSLEPRKEPIVLNHFKKEIKEKIEEPNIIKEQYDIRQGKLVIGLDILPNDFEDFRFISILYNAILGNGVHSKLFQIIREKEGLAYTTKSEYIVQKNNIIIRCGIECKNYEKTVKLIKKILKEIKDGHFTNEDLRKSKDFIIAGIDLIDEEQDSQILFKFGQELSKMEMSLNQYKENIEKVTKNEICEFAKNIQINTIYFLENGGIND